MTGFLIKLSDGYISRSASRFISADDIYSPLLDLEHGQYGTASREQKNYTCNYNHSRPRNRNGISNNSRRTSLAMMGGTPAAQPGGGMGGLMGHSDFNIVHHIKHHLKHHVFGNGHMSPNMGSPIHAPAY
jgi:hypothetical protein